MTLKADRANGRGELQRPTKNVLMGACEIAEKLRRPWPAIATIQREAGIDCQPRGSGQGHQIAGPYHRDELSIILYAAETFDVGDDVLMHQHFM
jgi:hypothetical protein